MRAWLTHDFYWKGFSVLIALGIWLTVHQFSGAGVATPGLLSMQVTYTNIPITIVSGTAGVHGVGITPKTVQVAVSGSPDAMAGLDAYRLHAFVDFTGVNAANGMTRHVDVAAPPRITILNVNPSTVTVTLPQ